MKALLTRLFSPLLNLFEREQGNYAYKPSHRTILVIVGTLFLILASFAIIVSVIANMLGGLFPGLVFLIVAVVCLVVGGLGSDRAVANLWKTR